MPFISSFAEASAVIPNGAKTFFNKGTTTLINGPANLLNNNPKILQIEIVYIFVL